MSFLLLTVFLLWLCYQITLSRSPQIDTLWVVQPSSVSEGSLQSANQPVFTWQQFLVSCWRLHAARIYHRSQSLVNTLCQRSVVSISCTAVLFSTSLIFIKNLEASVQVSVRFNIRHWCIWESMCVLSMSAFASKSSILSFYPSAPSHVSIHLVIYWKSCSVFIQVPIYSVSVHLHSFIGEYICSCPPQVGLHINHHLVLHSQPGCLPDCPEDGGANRVSGRPGRSDSNRIWHHAWRIHYDLLPGQRLHKPLHMMVTATHIYTCTIPYAGSPGACGDQWAISTVILLITSLSSCLPPLTSGFICFLSVPCSSCSISVSSER